MSKADCEALGKLANQLTRLAPNLRTIGITVNKDRKGHAGTRMIYLQREDETNDLKECNALARSLAKSDKGNGVKTITKKEDNSSTHPKLKELSESWKPVKPPKMKGGK